MWLLLRKEERSGFDWYHQEATPEQQKLRDRISEFSDFFTDMRFEPGTPTHELMKAQIATRPLTEKEMEEYFSGNLSKEQAFDAAEYEDYYLDPHEEIAELNYAWFTYTVKPLDDCEGYFDPAQQELCIPAGNLDDDATILHEMIHLHEFVYDCVASFYHDMAFWGLYTTLRAKIPKLDEIISTHASMLIQDTLDRQGGGHDVLFLLKSFDLDIRKGYPLGTVFAYEKTDDLKGYTYTP